MEEASSLDVLIAARDRIHLGWRLTHHPLYGNIRPRLQPFRSILLNDPEDGGKIDLYSLNLIGNAVAIYEEAKEDLSFPWSVPVSMKADCAFLDRELMRETLAQAGLPSRFEAKRGDGPDQTIKTRRPHGGEEGTS